MGRWRLQQISKMASTAEDQRWCEKLRKSGFFLQKMNDIILVTSPARLLHVKMQAEGSCCSSVDLEGGDAALMSLE